jgi:hypothetical protein
VSVLQTWYHKSAQSRGVAIERAERRLRGGRHELVIRIQVLDSDCQYQRVARLGVASSVISLLIRQRLQLLADAVDKASFAVLVALTSSNSANVLGVNRT